MRTVSESMLLPSQTKMSGLQLAARKTSPPGCRMNPMRKLLVCLIFKPSRQFPTGLRRIHNLEKLNQVAARRVWKSHNQALRLPVPLALTCGSRKTMGVALSVSP